MLFGAIFNHEYPTVWVFVGAAILISGLVLYFLQDIRASRKRSHRLKLKT